ncbi:MAG: hypothetical protein RMJ56_05965 [Gemmataceae bacterium]|nr:hypothetical protein [Gemmata sp.]MDW8197135.1 hypothetical protein [Gemmataceae bacterium]
MGTIPVLRIDAVEQPSPVGNEPGIMRNLPDAVGQQQLARLLTRNLYASAHGETGTTAFPRLFLAADTIHTTRTVASKPPFSKPILGFIQFRLWPVATAPVGLFTDLGATD